MIRRIAVKGYKSLRNVELTLKPLTVIIGPNATGKSNLFDALHLLKRIVRSRTLAEAFEAHRGDPIEAFSFGTEGISGLLKRDEARFTLEVDVELSESAIRRAEERIRAYSAQGKSNSDERSRSPIKERYLRYRVTVAVTPSTGVLRVMDESLLALKQGESGALTPKMKPSPFLERVDDRLRLRMERQARPTEYETNLSYAVASLPVHPPHYPHLTAFQEELESWQFYYFEPRVMREENPLKEARYLTQSGGDLAAFYYTLRREHPRQFDNIQRALRAIVPSLQAVDVELTEDGRLRLKVYETVDSQLVEFSAKVVSEGTLRLLGLMAILVSQPPASVVALEEPENGVHPRRLQLIARILQNASEHRQILINTHSPILPNYFEESDHLTLVSCKKEKGDTVFSPPNLTGLFREEEVKDALEEREPPLTITTMLLRGDLG
jgi:predicted ATPase